MIADTSLHIRRVCGVLLLFLTGIGMGCQPEADFEFSVMDGDFWKDQATEDILPYWTTHALDTGTGKFSTFLDGEWKSAGDSIVYPSMISRHIFSYAAAYLMTGKDEYIEIARKTKDFLIEKAWDREQGGWFDELDEAGNPVQETKNMFVQVYAITGLTMYYFVTHDREVLRYIAESNRLLESRAWDPENGGYFNVMNRDWTVADSRKTFAAQVAPLSGYLLTLYLATGNKAYLEQSKRIMDVVLDKMTGSRYGWILENFDSGWNYLPGSPDMVNIGHNLEVAWLLKRLALLEENRDYLDKALEISSLLDRWGYDNETGFWYASVMKEDPENHVDFTHWWIQAYGNMFSLFRYRTTGEEWTLTRFIEGAEAWNEYIIDWESGGTWLTVNTDGEVRNSAKANRFKSSYHSLEHSLLNFIYLHLWVELQPFELHFSIEPQPEDEFLYPVPVEDPEISVQEIEFNGHKREDVSEKEGKRIRIPAGEKIRISTTLMTGRQ